MVSIVKAHDVAYVRFRAPDPGQMRTFLGEFGMDVARESERELFMRGYGPAPFVHVTEFSDEPGFAALGIWVNTVEELERIARHDGRPIEELDAPGGGLIVRLDDPDGFRIEVVAGQTPAEPLEVPKHMAWNQGGDLPRQHQVRRVTRGRSHVRRLGHVVLGGTNFRRSEAWYKERFGLLTSDEIQPEPGITIGAFLRCDRGDQPCDHHTLFLLERTAPPGFMHAAFEVVDFDDLMAGHEYLKSRQREHYWGVGRHYLGSQIFDYWMDPWGHEMEHWTDGDQLTAADGGGIGLIPELVGVQWGMEMPPHSGARADA